MNEWRLYENMEASYPLAVPAAAFFLSSKTLSFSSFIFFFFDVF